MLLGQWRELLAQPLGPSTIASGVSCWHMLLAPAPCQWRELLTCELLSSLSCQWRELLTGELLHELLPFRLHSRLLFICTKWCWQRRELLSHLCFAFPVYSEQWRDQPCKIDRRPGYDCSTTRHLT